MKRSWFSRHPLCFMALYLILYLSAFNFLNTQIHMPHILVHCRLDDLIPFNEFFFIPYCFWYVLIVISLGYFLLYDIENFKNLQKYIIITQVVAMAVYIVYPSIQDLRPTEFARDNFFTHLAAFIYKMDTPTGVCPSLHVAYSLGIGSCWLKEKQAGKLWKAFVVFNVFLISAATMFVKQHSAIDVACALPLGLLAEILVFGKYWKAKFSRKPETV